MILYIVRIDSSIDGVYTEEEFSKVYKEFGRDILGWYGDTDVYKVDTSKDLDFRCRSILRCEYIKELTRENSK